MSVSDQLLSLSSSASNCLCKNSCRRTSAIRRVNRSIVDLSRYTFSPRRSTDAATTPHSTGTSTGPTRDDPASHDFPRGLRLLCLEADMTLHGNEINETGTNTHTLLSACTVDLRRPDQPCVPLVPKVLYTPLDPTTQTVDDRQHQMGLRFLHLHARSKIRLVVPSLHGFLLRTNIQARV